MKSFRPWLTPALLGPLLTTWGFATLGALAIGAQAISLGLAEEWPLLMMWATLFGSTFAVFVVTADVVLLSLKWRSLPTGARGWFSAMVTPIACYFGWMMMPQPETILGVVLTVMGPMLGAAFATRFLFGARP
ncbi:MAG TPA: hypothetical protein ENK57_20850 [Polyangiaceae bacterium]|nr:hypothetical protein [Polyangiaceae bacterium]